MKKLKKENKTLILAIESSSPTCSIALSEDDKLIAEITFYKKNLHDKVLANLIKQLLNNLKLKVEDLNAVAISAGPGSFTGLRVGASLAKGIAFDSNIKLIPIPTMEGIAKSSANYAKKLNCKNIVAAIQSHQDLYYVQEFDIAGSQLTEIKMLNYQDAKSIIKDHTFAIASDKFTDLGNNLEYFNSLKASFLIQSAHDKFINNQYVDSNSFVPLYIQDFNLKKSNKSK